MAGENLPKVRIVGSGQARQDVARPPREMAREWFDAVSRGSLAEKADEDRQVHRPVEGFIERPT
jgi:hypothetical protein